MSPRVLVFDSGVGGLSIADCIHRALPGVELVYLADTGAFPYGEQPESLVVERVTRLIARALADQPCDVAVVACNTASTIALPSLRAEIAVPVVGVVPAIKPAAARTGNGRVGVLATPATVRRPYLDRLIQEFASHCSVERLGHPGLVQWAEGLVRGVPVPEDALAEAVAPLRAAMVDTVVLGCTHYPLLLDSLRRVLPEVVHWVDSGEAIARRVRYLLDLAGHAGPAMDQRPGAGPVLTAALFSGAAPEGLNAFAERLGLPVGQVLPGWGS